MGQLRQPEGTESGPVRTQRSPCPAGSQGWLWPWARGRAPARGCSCALGLWALRASSGSSCSGRHLGAPVPFPRGHQRAPQASKPRCLQLWLLQGPARLGAGGRAAATQPQRALSLAQQLPALALSASVTVFVSAISFLSTAEAVSEPLLPPGSSSFCTDFRSITLRKEEAQLDEMETFNMGEWASTGGNACQRH